MPASSSAALLCSPERKAELEARNAVAQLDYIAYLVNQRRIEKIRESHISELHSICVADIYPCGGSYRDAVMRVEIQGSKHKIPHESQVRSLIWDLLDRINQPSLPGHYVYCAAYALWRLNWIHPFAGGNGRTARALGYLVLCTGFGAAIPGVPSMPASIAKRRDEYMRCLYAADESVEEGEPNITEMVTFVAGMLAEQLDSALRQTK